MKNKFLLIFYVGAFVLVTFIWPGKAISQYRISGVVEFAYYDLVTKTGNSTTSNPYWRQTYRANLQGDVLDPRFLKLSGGAGYSVYNYKNSSDSTMVDYTLNTTFFPGMKVSWNLFGNKSVNTIESTTNIAGYDVTTTSYGGTLNLRLGNAGRNGNRYNNNSGGGMNFPDISLSRMHYKSESLNPSALIDETRDDTKAVINYRANSSFDLLLSGTMENYENAAQNNSYETKAANLVSNIRVSTDAELRLNGTITDRTTDNFVGFNTQETAQTYNATLDFKERNGLLHYYRYDFNSQKTDTSELTLNSAQARVIYKIRDELRVQGGVDYSLADYMRKPTSPTDAGEKSGLESGGLLAGVKYLKKYTPGFMGPFSFDTGYDFSTGFSKLTSGTGGTAGSGWYYTNNVLLGLSSTGWKDENLSLSYNFNNKRDDSPIHNNSWQHVYRLALATRRIEKTIIRGTLGYTSQENRNDTGSIFYPTAALAQTQQAGTNQQRRTFMYDLTAEHTVSTYVNVLAGASRGQSTSTLFTLSTLQSATTAQDELYYGAVNFNYPFTRRLIYRAQLREELRSSQSVDTRSHDVRMNLDYRIRQIFFNVEYRLREDMPENGTRTVQQYYYATLSRQF